MKYPCITLFILCCLPACKQFTPKPLSATASERAFARRRLSDPGLKAFLAEHAATSGAWDVNKLALTAAYFHPDVALARKEADVAAAAIKTAKMRPNPVFSYLQQFIGNSSLSSIPYTPWFFGPNVTFPIETAGKRGKRTAQALAAAEAARWRVSARAWDARTRVRTAMLSLYAAHQNTTLLTKEAALHEDALNKLRAQVEEGEAAMFEITQAQLALNRAKLALHDAERQAATAREQLAGAVGVPISALNAASLDFSDFEKLPIMPAATARRKALTTRADLMALLSEYAASEAALRWELAKQYPDVGIRPGYDFNSGQDRWQLGLTMEIPLNQNRGPIAQAEARRELAAATFEVRQAAVIAEVGSAHAAYQASLAKLSTASRLADESKHSSEIAQKMVEAGELIPLDLVRRRIEASASDLALQTARVEAQTAAGQLEAALQVPLRHVK